MRIMAIAKKHNLWVIEDCAQAHLASYKGQLVEPLAMLRLLLLSGKKSGRLWGCRMRRDQ